MSADVCGTCGKPEDFPADSKSSLRPYGPGGALICFRCAFADPATEARTEAAFGALLEAAAAPTGVAVIGGNRGPDVFTPPAPTPRKAEDR